MVWIPARAFGDVMNESDGPLIKVTILPSAEPNKELWWVWRNMKEGMLRVRGEEAPFTDLHRPIAELAGTEFELVPWTPEYQDLHTQLQALYV